MSSMSPSSSTSSSPSSSSSSSPSSFPSSSASPASSTSSPSSTSTRRATRTRGPKKTKKERSKTRAPKKTSAERLAAKQLREMIAAKAQSLFDCLNRLIFNIRTMQDTIFSCADYGRVRDKHADSAIKHRYQFPLVPLIERTKMIRADWVLMPQLEAELSKLHVSNEKRNSIEKLRKIIDAEVVKLRADLVEHVFYVGSRNETAFLEVDYLSDPSDLPFNWGQEMWMSYMMFSSHNLEHHRARRERAEFVMMEQVVGNMEKCVWRNKKAGHLHTVELVEQCLAIQTTTISEVVRVKDQLIEYEKDLIVLDAAEQQERVQQLNGPLLELPEYLKKLNNALAAVQTSRGRARCNHCLDKVNKATIHIDFHLERVMKMTRKLVEDGQGEGLREVKTVDFTQETGFAVHFV